MIERGFIFPPYLDLRDSSLFRQQAYINGLWVDADEAKTFEVENPATGERIARVSSVGEPETQRAIRAAADALPGWRKKTGKERAAILRRWHDLIIESLPDLCRILTIENGKPLAEARGEYDYGLSILEWSAEEAKRIHGDVIPETLADQRLFAIRQPVGVCGAIIAWNFPAQLVLRKASPALAAGCTIVLKPADLTPISALALAELAARAGIPPGVLNVVTGDAAVIGRVLTRSPVVKKITFTGSTAVGRLLMEQSAPTIKRLSLELGGNAPLVVFEDADLGKAAEAVVASRFRNAGQTCVCANRVYVHDSIYDPFTSLVADRARALKMGNGLEEGVSIGPIIDARGLAKVTHLVESALSEGACPVVGAEPHELGGTFYRPTVLRDVRQSMAIAQEEIFGPVLSLIRFSDDAEVERFVNDSDHGLAAYFFTQNIRRAWRFAEAIESGMVGVNTTAISNEVGPFGGVKQSGLGREGSKHGIEEFLELKYICIGDMA